MHEDGVVFEQLTRGLELVQVFAHLSYPDWTAVVSAFDEDYFSYESLSLFCAHVYFTVVDFDTDVDLVPSYAK